LAELLTDGFLNQSALEKLQDEGCWLLRAWAEIVWLKPPEFKALRAAKVLGL